MQSILINNSQCHVLHIQNITYLGVFIVTCLIVYQHCIRLVLLLIHVGSDFQPLLDVSFGFDIISYVIEKQIQTL